MGYIGKQTAIDLAEMEGYNLKENYDDCGVLIYSPAQDAHAGGSGAGCSASVLCSYILPKIERGELSRVLFIPTGALLSPATVLQGESIPAIAHCVCMEKI